MAMMPHTNVPHRLRTDGQGSLRCDRSYCDPCEEQNDMGTTHSFEGCQELQHEVAALRRRVAQLEEANQRQSTAAALASNQAHALLQGLLDYSPLAIQVRDRQGRFLLANRLLLDKLGLSDPNEIIGKTLDDIWPPEVCALVRADEQQIIATGAPVTRERRARLRDGAYTLLSTLFPIYDEWGAIMAIGTISADITERQQAAAALRASEGLYRAIFEKNQAIKLLIDPETGAIVDANEVASSFYGYPVEALRSMNIADINPLPLWQIQTKMEQARHEAQRVFRFRHRLASGAMHDVEVYSGPLTFQGRDLLHSIIHDVTARVQAEQALHEAYTRLEQRVAERTAALMRSNATLQAEIAERRRVEGAYRTLVDHSLQGMAIVQEDQLVFANTAYVAITGYPVHELLALAPGAFLQLVHPNDRPMVAERHQSLLAGERASSNCKYRLIRKDASVRWIESYAVQTTYHARRAIHIASIDITERHQAEVQLRHQALHDELTGLPNRLLLFELLAATLQRVQQSPTVRCALLFLDLDNFKVVNDSLGHLEGDRLLVAVARRLEACLPEHAVLTRFSGDEFVLLLNGMTDSADARTVAETIRQALAVPVDLNGYHVHATASIGIAVSSPESTDPDSLMRDADAALYRAKALGRNCVVLFDEKLRADALGRLSMEADLRRALAHDQLCLHYQPIVKMASGQIAGFEVLVRWNHPAQGMISPAEFIPLAEETGLIVQIDQWVLRAACHQLRAWQTALPNLPPLALNVNLSARSFMRHDIFAYICAVLDASGLEPACLELEITESAMMDHTEATIATLKQLCDLGVGLCIDDFGTGWSSLRYLHRLPIQTLKIDRAFINHLHEDEESAAITQSIVALSHTLGKEVVAEGVETAAQLDYLRDLHCEYGQGYLFSRPVDSAAAGRLLVAQCSPVPPAISAPAEAAFHQPPPATSHAGATSSQTAPSLAESSGGTGGCRSNAWASKHALDTRSGTF